MIMLLDCFYVLLYYRYSGIAFHLFCVYLQHPCSGSFFFPYFFLSLFSKWLKVLFNGWAVQRRAVIKQFPDPLKHAHTLCPEHSDRAKNSGTLAAMHGAGFDERLQQHKVHSCSLYRPKDTDLHSITKAVVAKPKLVRYLGSELFYLYDNNPLCTFSPFSLCLGDSKRCY